MWRRAVQRPQAVLVRHETCRVEDCRDSPGDGWFQTWPSLQTTPRPPPRGVDGKPHLLGRREDKHGRLIWDPVWVPMVEVMDYLFPTWWYPEWLSANPSDKWPLP